MGCLSVNVSQVPPTVSTNILNSNSMLSTELTPVNTISTIVSKGWNSADILATDIATNMEISAWLVCKVGIEGVYLAVNDGLIITLDNKYLKVIKE